jgi:hypothetical protein
MHDGMATSPGYNGVFISEGVHIFLFRSHLKSNSIRNLTDSYDAACPLCDKQNRIAPNEPAT